jgi:hypothetical protein
MRSMAISLILLTVGACQNPAPDILFVYLGAPDEISHNIGRIVGLKR